MTTILGRYVTVSPNSCTKLERPDFSWRTVNGNLPKRNRRVNGADVQQRSGHYPPPPDASAVLGLEVARRVAARGGEVTQWNIDG